MEPLLGPRLQVGHVFAAHFFVLDQLVERRVVKRPDHARHIAQGGAFQAAFTERTYWLTFKVNDDEILARKQHLAQVVVAVVADLVGVEFMAVHALHEFQDVGAHTQHFFGFGAHRFGQRVQFFLQQVKRAAHLRHQRRIQRTLVMKRIRFRLKTFFVRVRGQGQVHFGGALAQQPHPLHVRAAEQLLHYFGNLFKRDRLGKHPHGWQYFHMAVFGQFAVKEPAQHIAKVRPRIALVGHEFLHHAQHHGGVFGLLVFEGTDKFGHVFETGLLGQKAGYFQIRIVGAVQFAVNLEEILVVENRRGIALLGIQDLGFHFVFPGSAQGFFHVFGHVGVQVAITHAHLAFLRHQGIQHTAELIAVHGIVEHAFFAAHQHRHDHRLRVFVADFPFLVAKGQRHRQRIHFGQALVIVHFQHEKRRFAAHRRDGDVFHDLHRLDCAGFAAKPTATEQVGREYFVLQKADFLGFRQLIPVREFQGGQLAVVPCRSRHLHFFQCQPIIAVRREREQVVVVFDGGEGVVAEHLDGFIAPVSRQIQLNRLRETRQVGHHQHDLVFVGTDESQYF